MFSKTCEYGIKAMLHIAQKSQSNERVGVNDIALAINSPRAFTGKILQQLSRNGLVQSIKGRSGGFWIDDDNRAQINLRQIVEAIDGNFIYVRCELGLEQCSDINPCPLHDENKKIRAAIIKLHTETKLNDLATKLQGIATLK